MFRELRRLYIFFISNFLAFVQDKRAWFDSESTPDRIEPVVKTTTNLLQGPVKCCCVVLFQQSFPFLRSGWVAGFYVISEELISFSCSTERDGSFPVSLIGFSGFISICRHALSQ